MPPEHQQPGSFISCHFLNQAFMDVEFEEGPSRVLGNAASVHDQRSQRRLCSYRQERRRSLRPGMNTSHFCRARQQAGSEPPGAARCLRGCAQPRRCKTPRHLAATYGDISVAYALLFTLRKKVGSRKREPSVRLGLFERTPGSHGSLNPIQGQCRCCETFYSDRFAQYRNHHQ